MESMPDPKDSLRQALDFFENESEDGAISKERLKGVLDYYSCSRPLLFVLIYFSSVLPII